MISHAGLKSEYVRPDLRSLLGNDGKSDLIIVESDPGDLTQ